MVVKSARGLSIKAGALLIRTVWGTKLAGLRRVWSRQGDVTDKKNGGIKDFPDIAASSPAKYMQKHIPGWHDKGSFS